VIAEQNGNQTTADLIIATEHELVLRAYEELKRRGDGEIRIAGRRDPKTRAFELVYVGVHQKADLEPLRKLYEKMRREGGKGAVTF
jgi:hypothetical protein